ncbi:hypothetical protein Plhal304r1_c010g0039231 [Plasmopara halstedii]
MHLEPLSFELRPLHTINVCERVRPKIPGRIHPRLHLRSQLVPSYNRNYRVSWTHDQVHWSADRLFALTGR